eukprot:TRINITY_DN13725_c0_g1_i2.p1 TRINITY_DN13725_c0_g1~~TRINITY_DN13725_c0_g1_i2.p1  ORF type:complete len:571 (+),score=106.88 TRINITY_DN13725_c0_g1_i2:70-1782(+)
MGGVCGSNSKSRKKFTSLTDQDKLRLIGKVFDDIKKVVMNMTKKPAFAFNTRLIKENYYSIPLLGQMVHCGPGHRIEEMYAEFLKFIVLNAISVAETGIILTAPPLIDRVWREAILYTKGYQNLCSALSHISGIPYLDRVDPRVVPDQTFDRYTRVFQLNQSYGMRVPNLGLNVNSQEMWPQVSNSNEFAFLFSNTKWVNNDQIAGAFEGIAGRFPLQFGNEMMASLEFAELIRRIKVPPTSQFRNIAVVGRALSTFQLSPTAHIAAKDQMKKRLTEAQLREAWDKIMNKIFFPPALGDILQREQLITPEVAGLWMLEYRKFLLMAFCSSEMVSPSPEVDEVWHLHMVLSPDYRKMCSEMFGRYLNHNPSEGGPTEDEKYDKFYVKTLDLYSKLFTTPPMREVWSVKDESRPAPHYHWADLMEIVCKVNRQAMIRQGDFEQRRQELQATVIPVAQQGIPIYPNGQQVQPGQQVQAAYPAAQPQGVVIYQRPVKTYVYYDNYYYASSCGGIIMVGGCGGCGGGCLTSCGTIANCGGASCGGCGNDVGGCGGGDAHVPVSYTHLTLPTIYSV